MDFHEKKEQAIKGDAESPDDWDLHKPDFSWKLWLMLEAIEWKFLPVDGNLLDQPEWLMDDLMTIAFQSQIVKQQRLD